MIRTPVIMLKRHDNRRRAVWAHRATVCISVRGLFVARAPLMTQNAGCAAPDPRHEPEERRQEKVHDEQAE
jgi:hypothetical protein